MTPNELLEQCKEFDQANDPSAFLDFIEKHQYEFDPPTFYYRLKAEALMQLNQDDQAISCCETCLSLYPNDAESYANFALFYGYLYKFSKAIPYAKKAFDMQETIEHGLLLASCYYSNQEYAKAQSFYEQLNGIEPDLDFCVELAIIYHFTDEQDKADTYFKEALEKDMMNYAELNAYYQNCIDLGLYIEANDVITVMLNKYPEYLTSTTELLIRLLVFYVRDFNTAKRFMKKIKDKEHGLSDFFAIMYAFMSYVNRRYKKGLEYLDQVKDPQYFINDYHLTKGLLACTQKDYQTAVDCLSQIEDIYKDPHATLHLIQAYTELGNYDESIKLLRNAYQTNKYDPGYNRLATAIEEKFGINIKNDTKKSETDA